MPSIDGFTKVAGVIGDPITHTASPAMHNKGYEALGINAIYIPIHVQPNALQDAINGLRAFSFLGANVTIPYKEKVIPFLDHLDTSAAQVGAVNTIVNQNGVLTGYNTDGQGFVFSLTHEAGMSCKDKAVVIIGSGGSAKGISHALLAAGISKLTILSRRDLPAFHPSILTQNLTHKDDVAQTLSEADIVINTTPVGMGDLEGQSPLEEFSWVRSTQLCCDIIYKPKMTKFLSECQAKGAQILGGAGMLAGQGVLAFELMTGKPLSFETMRSVI